MTWKEVTLKEWIHRSIMLALALVAIYCVYVRRLGTGLVITHINVSYMGLFQILNCEPNIIDLAFKTNITPPKMTSEVITSLCIQTFSLLLAGLALAFVLWFEW